MRRVTRPSTRLAAVGAPATALAFALALAPAAAWAQQRGAPPPLPELRADVIVARTTTVQGGVGVSLPAGRLVRLELVGAVGSTLGQRPRATGRADAIARFLLDPYAERRWGLYGGGGVSARFTRGQVGRGVLVLVVGAEGRPRRGLAPFVELGLGGGVRLGAGLRRAVRGWR